MSLSNFDVVRDFLNVCGVVICPMIGCFLWLYFLGWISVFLYIFGVFVNVVVIYTIIKAKYFVIAKVMDAIRRHDQLPVHTTQEESRIERQLKESINLCDLTEFAFGRFGRMLSLWSLLVSLCCIGISRIVVTGNFMNQILYFAFPPYNVTNDTKNDEMYQKGHEVMDKSTMLGIITVVMFVILVVSSLPRNLRSYCLSNLIGVVAILIAAVHVVIFLVRHSTNDTCNKSILSEEALRNFYSGGSSMTQIGALVIVLENSMVGNHHRFRIFVAIAMVIAMLPVVAVDIDLIVDPNDIHFFERKLPLFKALYCAIAAIIYDVVYGLFITSVLAKIIEHEMAKLYQRRRTTRHANTEINEVSMLIYFDRHRTRPSIFGRLRLETESALVPEDVARELNVQAPQWLRYLIRIFLPIFQLACAWLIWSFHVMLPLFSIGGILATSFVSYIIPVAQYLRMKWFVTTRIVKLGGVLIILAGSGLTIYCEVASFFLLY